MDEVLKTENLNVVQKNLIVELKQLITADLYKKDKINPNEDEMEYLKVKMKREFGFEKAKAFFTEINGKLAPPSPPLCSCSTSDDWCAWWNSCDLGLNACQSSEGLDCGWLWQSQCNGGCN